jgi:hypothetical protein
MLYRNLIGSIAMAALVSVASGVGAQAQDLSKYPDWSGQWKRTSGIQWDPSKPLGPAQAGRRPEDDPRNRFAGVPRCCGGMGCGGISRPARPTS